jgi:hypothetical protein
MKRFTLICPLILALACSGEDPKRGNGAGLGDGDGSGDGDGNGRGISGDGCEEHIVKPMRVTPDMLIVLDRSGSMQMNGVNRWDPSVMGLNAITAKLDDVVRFGLMTFPAQSGDGQNAGNNQLNCDPGELNVPVELNNADDIANVLGDTSPGGRTPTAKTLENVLDVLEPSSQDPDAVFYARYVLLVTDGAPNCSGQGGFSFGAGMGEPAAVDASVAAVQALAKAGIPTYVLGYDTKNDRALAEALDRMATAGDTGDMAHRPIEDQESLVREFDRIAGGAVTCDYLLLNEVDPAFVRVELDGETLSFDDPNGWRLRQDARTVSLQGTACDKLRTGDDHTFAVTVECVELF